MDTPTTAKPRITWTEEEENKVAASFWELRKQDRVSNGVSLLEAAMTVLPAGRRRPSDANFLVRLNNSSAGVLAPRRRYTRKAATTPKPSTNGEHESRHQPRPASADLTIGDAVELLCAVIIDQVRVNIGPKIESTVASGIVAAAVKVSPKPLRAVNPDKLRALNALQLRFELIKAKGEGDTIRAAKITKEFSRRDASANIIQRESSEE